MSENTIDLVSAVGDGTGRTSTLVEAEVGERASPRGASRWAAAGWSPEVGKGEWVGVVAGLSGVNETAVEVTNSRMVMSTLPGTLNRLAV